MCGIAGIVSLTPMRVCTNVIAALQSSLRHRGPDDQGAFVDPSGVAAMVQTRLAILDLSNAGHQPMHSKDGRYVIVFNGEIYNYRLLREELLQSGFRFVGDSDTEVLLALYGRDGQACVDSLKGMFAFAIWDTLDKTLFLARDPLGIKPLYIWQESGVIAFASEVRALLETSIAPRRLNQQALADYLRLGSVQEPETLIQNIVVLPAGQTLFWKNGSGSRARYWQSTFVQKGSAEGIYDTQSAVQLTSDGLKESIDRHFVSDVPVGIFLSGGIDSTSLVSLARSRGHDNLQTFCISFDQQEFNEGELAKKTAAHFGTKHSDWRITGSDGRRLIEQYLVAMDQPSNDGFNTFCVSKLAHDHGMKVVLSGLGGDELFGGYPSFQTIPRLVAMHQNISRIHGRVPAALLMRNLSRNNRWKRLADYLESDGSVLHAWRATRGFFTDAEVDRLTQWITQSPASYDVGNRQTTWCSALLSNKHESTADQISRCEIQGYMRNQLLRDSDVMSMAWGLELRVPFVDRTLMDKVTTIHSSIRLRAGKQLLREAVPEIPEWILKQPKRGFRFPFEEWACTSWAGMISELQPQLPVRCGAWHRFWSLFVLRHFLATNHIEGADGLLAPQRSSISF